MHKIKQPQISEMLFISSHRDFFSPSLGMSQMHSDWTKLMDLAPSENREWESKDVISDSAIPVQSFNISYKFCQK